MASSLGKMPTTLVRRLISPLRRSIGLVLCSLGRMQRREVHIGEHVLLGGIHEGSQLGHLGPELVGRHRQLVAVGRVERRDAGIGRNHAAIATPVTFA